MFVGVEDAVRAADVDVMYTTPDVAVSCATIVFISLENVKVGRGVTVSIGNPVPTGVTEEVVTIIVEMATVFVGFGVEVFGTGVALGMDVFGTDVDFGLRVFVGGFPAGLPLCCTSPTSDLACAGTERILVSTSIPINIVMGIHVNFDVGIS